MNIGLAAIVGGRTVAINPQPADGALYSDTWVNLTWLPAEVAVSHDVYMGENFADVEAGTGDTFRGNVGATYFLAGLGLPGDPYPGGLVPGTTYYWRIDEVNDLDPNSPWKGKVWSFTIPPNKAYEPVPPDGAAFTDPNVSLSWTAGLGTKLHWVYFGENAADVQAGTGETAKGQVPGTTFAPGPLALDTTYYWRIDEFDGVATHTGDLWSFTTTLPGLGTIASQRWENITTTDLNELKNNVNYPDNPDVTEVLTEFQWDGADLSDYGAKIFGWVYAPATGDYTFWLCTDDQGELWLSSDDDPDSAELIAYVKDSPTATGGWAPVNDFTKYASQMSAPVSLKGGERRPLSGGLGRSGYLDTHDHSRNESVTV